jgi:hypothetical protein
MEHRNKELLTLVQTVQSNPHKYTFSKLQELTGLTYDQVNGALRRAELKQYVLKEKGGIKSSKIVPQRKARELIPSAPNTENVLVIGDLHEPFTLEGYREFCWDTYKKFKCTHVIFIGDVLDFHALSYHEHDADGLSAGDELDQAIERIGEWAKLFPRADSIIGNHCRLVMRKAFTGGIPKRWIMDFQDVLGTPGWDFKEEALYDGVHYIHGEGGTARLRCKKDLISTVQGHLHPQAYTEHFVGQHYHIFAMQVGCGVDRKSYAMAYAKNHPKPAIGVGLILDHGRLPMNLLMPLD